MPFCHLANKIDVVGMKNGRSIVVRRQMPTWTFHAGHPTDMAIPKRRPTSARTGTRRAHDQKKPKQLHYCPKCSAAVPSHVVCPQCGYYMGRVIVETEEDSDADLNLDDELEVDDAAVVAATDEIKCPGRTLGIKTADIDSIIEQLKEGFPYKAVTNLEQGSGLSLERIADLVHIPARTLARRKLQNQFESDESERLLRLAVVFEKSLDLFNGNVTGARQWLESPALALGGKTPLEMSRTEIGAREVEDLIGRLEHGVYT